jgi:putative endonuclease
MKQLKALMKKLFKRPPQHIITGKKGEAKARAFLRVHGYRILDKTIRSGKTEIDIVAEHKKTGTLVFAEVKTRSEGQLAAPRAAVNFKKRENIRKAAQRYIAKKLLRERYVRYDIIEVYAPKYTINHIENAFGGERY